MGYTKLIRSGNTLEIYEYEKGLPTKRKHPRKVIRKPKNLRFIARRRPDNLKRLRKGFVRLVASNLNREAPPVFVTLTMAQIVPIGIAYEQFAHFRARLRRYLGIDFKYIAVPEFQKRGAVHFHMLLWAGSLNKELMYERDNRYLQRLWLLGFVDIMQTDGDIKLAHYLGKYLSKSLCDQRLSGEKAYSASRNVVRPLSIPFASALDYTQELFGIDIDTEKPLHEIEYETYWLGKGRYRKFNLE